MEVGFELFDALERLALYRPDSDALEAPVGSGALRFGRLCETYPDAVFCALLGHRPSHKRTPWGLQQRIAALRMRGVVDDALIELRILTCELVRQGRDDFQHGRVVCCDS